MDAWLVAIGLVCVNQRETKVNLIADNLILHDKGRLIQAIILFDGILIVPNFNIRILGGGLLLRDGKVALHYFNSVVAILGILGIQHVAIDAGSFNTRVRANVSDRAKVVFIDQSSHRAGKLRIIFAYYLRFVSDSDGHSFRVDLKCNIIASQIGITDFSCLDAYSHKTFSNISYAGSISSPISIADLVVNGVAVSTAYANGMRFTVIRPLAALSGQRSAAGRGLDLKAAFLYGNLVIGIISVLGIQHVTIGANSFNIRVRADISDLAKVASVNQIRRNRAGERGIVLTKELFRIVDLDRHLFRGDRQRASTLLML